MNGKIVIALMIAGLIAAFAVLASATTEPANSWHYTPRDIWLACGAFLTPAGSYLGTFAAGAKPVASFMAVAMLLFGLNGCTSSGSITGHLNPLTGDSSIDAGVTFKSPVEIAAAIKQEKTWLAAEKTAHESFQKQHKARLKKLEHGVWAEPIADAHPPGNPPVILPPVALPPDASRPATWGVLFAKNKYPGAELRGCLNDIADVKAYCAEKFGLDAAHTFELTDEQATTEAEKRVLAQAVAKVRPGDRFIFWDSGHGAKWPGADGKIHYVTCPIDFDWSEEHIFSSDQIKGELSNLPPGALGDHGSDTCFSGNLDKAACKPGDRPKTFPNMPTQIAARIERIERAEVFRKREFIDGELNIGFISGCGPEQTSADTTDENGRPCGAMTHYFLLTIRKPGNDAKPIVDLVKQMDTQLKADGYDQKPEASGARKDKPFLKSENDIQRVLRLPVWTWHEREHSQAA